jgi:hypothetical protein
VTSLMIVFQIRESSKPLNAKPSCPCPRFFLTCTHMPPTGHRHNAKTLNCCANDLRIIQAVFSLLHSATGLGSRSDGSLMLLCLSVRCSSLEESYSLDTSPSSSSLLALATFCSPEPKPTISPPRTGLL